MQIGEALIGRLKNAPPPSRIDALLGPRGFSIFVVSAQIGQLHLARE
jgi:hypothetical protein